MTPFLCTLWMRMHRGRGIAAGASFGSNGSPVRGSGLVKSRLVLVVVVVLAAAACGGGDTDTEDRRPDLQAELGGPDAFVVTVDEVGGRAVRFESWMYYEAATQIDMVDGEVLWTIDVEPLPDGTLYPLQYDPGEFILLASMSDVQAGLVDVDLVEVSVGEEVVPGGVFLAGDQLLLGFVDDRLVYVETFPLAPEGDTS